MYGTIKSKYYELSHEKDSKLLTLNTSLDQLDHKLLNAFLQVKNLTKNLQNISTAFEFSNISINDAFNEIKIRQNQSRKYFTQKIQDIQNAFRLQNEDTNRIISKNSMLINALQTAINGSNSIMEIRMNQTDSQMQILNNSLAKLWKLTSQNLEKLNETEIENGQKLRILERKSKDLSADLTQTITNWTTLLSQLNGYTTRMDTIEEELRSIKEKSQNETSIQGSIFK